MKINKENLLESVFFPRKSTIPIDENDHLVDVSNSVKVGIRVFIKDKKAPTILYFHANAEITNDYDDFATIYHHYGINLIVAGYRGYGHSYGYPGKESLQADSLHIFEYVKNYLIEHSISSSLIIMGRSLGSAAAIHVISKKLNDLDGCIIESGFATEIPLLNLMNINPTEIDFKLEDGFENLKKIKEYVKPLLVIHAEIDDIIPFSQADMLMIEAKSINKKIFKVEGAGHNNIISIAREHYFSNIRDFIENI
tara:strand:+ start:242 stop:1000 length:759 start_codon:yes stop_codon:yes gene_type:complete